MKTWLGRRGGAVAVGSLLSVSVALAGCHTKAPPPPPPPITGVDALVAALAEVACDWQARCCSPIEAEQGGGFADKDECLSHAKLELTKAASSLRFAVAQYFIEPDAGLVEACVDKQKNQGCFPSHPVNGSAPFSAARWLQACLPAYQGKVIAGARCADPAECIEGTHCATVQTVGTTSGPDGGAGPAGQVDKICLANQKRGEACLVNEDCDTAGGDYCHTPDYHCAARVSAGGACDYVLQLDPLFGGRLVASPACKVGLICDPQARVCVHPPKEKEECQPGSFVALDCDPDPAMDLFCAGAGFDGRGVCAVAGKEGDACAGSELPPCTGGLACNRGGERGLGLCGPPPKVDEPCSLDNACESPARCVFSTGICTMPGERALGQPCTQDTDCASLACSSRQNGVCQVTPTNIPTCSGANVNRGTSGGLIPPDGGAFDASFTFDARPLPAD
jgi:hypothetical protein